MLRNGWARPGPKDRQVAERSMVYADVADIRDRPLTELSGGEKQRALVAMALAQEPRLILMDEATSHLDLNHRLEIMQLIEQLNRDAGVTVVMISHDLNLAADFCRRLLLLDRGRIAADGRPAAVLTEENLREVYHCDVRVQVDPQTGGISMFPARRLAAAATGRGVRVHVVAGGGCGEEILRRLALCGHHITCGVLNELDTDATTTDALGLAVAREKPFSPIGHEALAAAQALAADADVLLVCNVPFGPGNLPNLDLAEAALKAGKQVLVRAGIETRDYTHGREATTRVRRLVASGAREWHTVTDLMRMLEPTRPA